MKMKKKKEKAHTQSRQKVRKHHVRTLLTYCNLFSDTQVYPTHLSALECNASSDNRISLRPTLPIRGDRDIKVTFGTKDDLDALLASECELTLKHGEEHEWTNISIQAVCDNTNRIYGLSSFTFAVTDVHDFWHFGHETSPVTVSFTSGLSNAKIT